LADDFVPRRTTSEVVTAYLDAHPERRDDHWVTKTRGRLLAAIAYFRDRPLHTHTARDAKAFARRL
jgi:hypothetical protein